MPRSSTMGGNSTGLVSRRTEPYSGIGFDTDDLKKALY